MATVLGSPAKCPHSPQRLLVLLTQLEVKNLAILLAYVQRIDFNLCSDRRTSSRTRVEVVRCVFDVFSRTRANERRG